MLKLVSTQKVGVSYPLLVDKKYTVGRKQGDITFPDDQSVSRIHAEVIVEHPAGNINEPLLTPVLTLEDVGSKFGTFATEDNINSKTAINARERVTLSVGDKLRFGLQWNEYRVDYTPLVVSSSSFKATPDFKVKIVKLGGHYVNEWNGFVTHVVMESLTLTVKAVCALLAAKPIVTPAYLADLLSAFETRKPPPDPKDFLPPVKEKGMSNLSLSCFHTNGARTTIFAGKTFLFCSSKHLKKLAAAIEAGGGIAKLLTDLAGENVLKSEYIIMGHQLDIADGEKDSRLKGILGAYKHAGKRFIADSEIGLAAVHNSIEKHCNPKYSMASAFMPHLTTQTQTSSGSSVPIVPETQDLETTGGSGNGDGSIDVVNETVVRPSDGGQTIDRGTKTSQAQATRGEKRGIVESDSSSSKKRSAEESLSRPCAKRLKEVPTPFSNSTRTSHQKSNSNRVLNSLFNFSDDDDDDEVIPETQPEPTDGNDKDAEVDVVPESQVPLVSVVDVRNLQSVESTQASSTRDRAEEEIFRIPPSPAMLEEPENDNGCRLGTDFIETVTTTVMNAKTVPLTSKIHEGTLNDSVVSKNVKRAQTYNQADADRRSEEGPSRKRRRGDEAESLVEKTKKINLNEQRVQKEGIVISSSLPFIKKPLMNKNHSRDVSLLGTNSFHADSGKKNYKSFRKVPPTFVNSSNHRDNKSGWIDTTDKSGGKSYKLTTYTYYPGETNYKYGVVPPPLDPKPGRGMDDDTPEAFIRFDDTTPLLDNILQRERNKRENEERKRQAQKANGTTTKDAEQPSTSAGGRRTSPRKKGVNKAPTSTPPPIIPIILDDEEEDEDDVWTFNR